MALTTNRVEWTCYLDLRTGEVCMVSMNSFGGDGDWPSEEEIDAGLEAGHLLPAERGRWFAFRDERLHASARA